jgi:hypothetical protein
MMSVVPIFTRESTMLLQVISLDADARSGVRHRRQHNRSDSRYYIALAFQGVGDKSGRQPLLLQYVEYATSSHLPHHRLHD